MWVPVYAHEKRFNLMVQLAMALRLLKIATIPRTIRLTAATPRMSVSLPFPPTLRSGKLETSDSEVRICVMVEVVEIRLNVEIDVGEVFEVAVVIV